MGRDTTHSQILDTSDRALFKYWIHDSTATLPTSDTAVVDGILTLQFRSVLALSPDFAYLQRFVDTIAKHRFFHPVIQREIIITEMTRDTLNQWSGYVRLHRDTLDFHAQGRSPFVKSSPDMDYLLYKWKIRFGDQYTGLHLQGPDGRGEWFGLDPENATFRDTACNWYFHYCASMAPPRLRGEQNGYRLPRDSAELFGNWVRNGYLEIPSPPQETLNQVYIGHLTSELIIFDSGEFREYSQLDTMMSEISRYDSITGAPEISKHLHRGFTISEKGYTRLQGDSLFFYRDREETDMYQAWKVSLTEHGFAMVATKEDGAPYLYIRKPKN